MLCQIHGQYQAGGAGSQCPICAQAYQGPPFTGSLGYAATNNTMNSILELLRSINSNLECLVERGNKE